MTDRDLGTFRQVRRAYEAHFKKYIPLDYTVLDTVQALARELGDDHARELIQFQSNDPAAPELDLDLPTKTAPESNDHAGEAADG